MFAVIYNESVVARFKSRNLAFRYLIRQGWEWDDRAFIREFAVA